MARGDTGKWVARAGATGGGRSYRGQRPMKWYASLAMICLLGVALIVYSRYERQHPAALGAARHRRPLVPGARLRRVREGPAQPALQPQRVDDTHPRDPHRR